jgi:hypothetical protein
MIPIYVIGDALREPSQCAYLQNYFESHGISATFFQPTYKDTLTESEVSRFTESTHGRPFKPAEKSIFLNFFYLFEHCLKTHQDGYVLLLESDVIFEGDLVKYLDGLKPFLEARSPHLVSIGSGCDCIDDDVNTDDMSFQIAKKTVVRCMDTLLFSIEGVRLFLDSMKQYGPWDEPIDNFLDRFVKQYESSYTYYWVWPSITLQGSQYGHYTSTIQDS